MKFLSGFIGKLARGVLFRAFDPDRILDRALQKKYKRFVFAWVRGLGDVAFVLNEFTRYVRAKVPDAEVSALVRPGLEEACEWIEGIKKVIPVDEWSRERTLESLYGLAFPPPWEIKKALKQRGIKEEFDCTLPYPLGKWYYREPEKRRPRLRWTERDKKYGMDFIRLNFPDGKPFIISLNTHTQTNRYYDREKDWGQEKFNILIKKILESIPGSRLILVDSNKMVEIPKDNRILDMREMLSVAESVSVVAESHLFIGLDTGLPNLLYFLEGASLDMLILLGAVYGFTPLRYPPASPKVSMITVLGEGEDISKITPDTVYDLVDKIYKKWLEKRKD